ncbi:30S ribosomal protein S20 [Candidatus Kaiserbacteria bacterium]|nr:30S ribosomal protein S20 [Candidatus Kaiserbacteria bacterium]
MAIIKSAKKAHRQSLRKRVVNLRRSRAMKDAVADFKKALTGGSAASQIPTLYQTIDKAVKQGVIKPNTGARMKSRLTKRLSTAGK